VVLLFGRAQYQVDRLDNLAPDVLKTAAQTLKARFPHALIEGSGGITEETIASYMSPGLLTH
jgi:nicotinate-nucleotide pyrophosphorylase (carboxylating)